MSAFLIELVTSDADDELTLFSVLWQCMLYFNHQVCATLLVIEILALEFREKVIPLIKEMLAFTGVSNCVQFILLYFL